MFGERSTRKGLFFLPLSFSSVSLLLFLLFCASRHTLQSVGVLRLGGSKIEWVSEAGGGSSSSSQHQQEKKALPYTEISDVDWTRMSRNNRLRLRTHSGMQLNFLNLRESVSVSHYVLLCMLS